MLFDFFWGYGTIKKIFEIDTNTTNGPITTKDVSSIKQTKKMINSLLFYIGRELYRNIHDNNHLQSFDKHEEYLSQKSAEIKDYISIIKQPNKRR